MKPHYYCLVLIFVLTSCRPYKSALIDANQMTYSQFRTDQNQFSLKEGALHYIDKGQGDVIVLLHVVPTSGWLYRHMIDELSQHYRVIVPDMLGFGSSDSPKGYNIYSEEKHAERLLALMDYLKVPNWTRYA